MAYVVYPSTIANPHILTAAELNDNFAAIVTQVNGNLDGDNVSADADLALASLTADSVTADEWNISRLCTIKLASTNGSHSVSFKDGSGNTVLRVYSDGGVVVG